MAEEKTKKETEKREDKAKIIAKEEKQKNIKQKTKNKSEKKSELKEKVKKENKKEKEKPDKRKLSDIDVDAWHPKTGTGLKVKTGEIKDIDKILNKASKIMESEIVDILIPDLEKDLLLIGQSKGKFGGGQRRVFKQTQKKTPEGNKPRFATYAVVGNRNGYIGLGYGKAKETVPAREKAFKNAKLNIMKIKRGCGSWECGCKTPHSIPFAVEGKCSSVRIRLMPAPKGTGLKVERTCAKILEMAGIKDIWSQSYGQTKSKINLIKALISALEDLNTKKLKPNDYEKLGIAEGKIKKD
jgi:small subunit ribosomal protein S5